MFLSAAASLPALEVLLLAAEAFQEAGRKTLGAGVCVCARLFRDLLLL